MSRVLLTGVSLSCCSVLVLRITATKHSQKAFNVWPLPVILGADWMGYDGKPAERNRFKRKALLPMMLQCCRLCRL
ncbi:hypothetical protein C8J56DRAFT_935236 [Mycena floridula]|nr:hypothetical protein C8J56DRAFT_935236 [Mycena floridula]